MPARMRGAGSRRTLMGLAARIKAAPEAQRQLYTPPVPRISVGKWKAHAYIKRGRFAPFLG